MHLWRYKSWPPKLMTLQVLAPCNPCSLRMESACTRPKTAWLPMPWPVAWIILCRYCWFKGETEVFWSVTESEFLKFSTVIESFGPLIHMDLRIQIPLGIMWKIYLSPQLAWNSSIIPSKPLVLNVPLQLRDLHAGNSACKTKFSNREG